MKKYSRVCWCASPKPNHRSQKVNQDACKCSRCHGWVSGLSLVARRAH